MTVDRLSDRGTLASMTRFIGTAAGAAARSNGVAMSTREHAYEGNGRVVHIVFASGMWMVTACNGEPFTTGHRKRVFTRTDSVVNCKRCLAYAAPAATEI